MIAPTITEEAVTLVKLRFYHDAANAPATVRAYARDLAKFKVWCDQADLVALPAEPEVVGAYIAAARAEYAYSSLCRQVAAIARASALAGAPLNTKHHAIKETLRGIARTRGARDRRATALTVSDFECLMSECDKGIRGEAAARLTALRDRALLLLAWAGALRRSELVAIDVAHITWNEGGFTVLMTKSRRSGSGKGTEIRIAASKNKMTCPAAALRSWLDQADICAGPVFRKVARGGHVQIDRLTGAGVWQIVKKRTAAAGLRAASSDQYLSPHSLRAGAVAPADAQALRWALFNMNPLERPD